MTEMKAEHPDGENALLRAGQIAGLALSLPYEAWLAAFDSEGLRPEYRDTILHVILLRQALAREPRR